MVVYRNRANLPFDPDAVGAVVDERTSEYYCADLELGFEEKFPSDIRVAVHKWIGNIVPISLTDPRIGTERTWKF